LTVEEALRPGNAMWRVQEGENFSSFWAPEDLCLLPYLPWFVKNRITALKIEGRMKSSVYVAQTADVYSTALNLLTGQQSTAEQNSPKASPEVSPETSPEISPTQPQFDYVPFLRELFAISVRPLGTGFFLPDKRLNIADFLPKNQFSTAALSHAGQEARILAKILEPGSTADSWVIEVKDNWENAESIELMLPGMQRPALLAKDYCLENHRGEKTGSAANGTRATLHTDFAGIQPGIFIRSSMEAVFK
jgi:putative protease